MTVDLPRFCLGGDVFGWTADEAQSTAVLDAAVAAGVTFLDTSDVYCAWAHDGIGGQSEAIIGRWMAARRNRDAITLATKVGWLNLPHVGGLRADNLTRGIEASLRRLQTDRVDLYYAHRDDGGDLTETLSTFDGFVRAGKIRAYGLSNFAAERVRAALAICAREGFTRPAALQPKYSLMERDYEADLRDVAAAAGMQVMPYSALATGFLTGKYRPDDGASADASPRAGGARAYLAEPRGPRVLAALDAAASAHGVPVAAVALAWLRDQPTVTAPITSARTPEQVEPLAAAHELVLSEEQLAALDAASR